MKAEGSVAKIFEAVNGHWLIWQLPLQLSA